MHGATMTWDTHKEQELAVLLERFSGFIRSHIQKYNVQRLGLDVEDILQETQIKLWKIIQNEKKIVNYTSYIKKIVDTAVMDFFRRFRREEEVFYHEKNKMIAEINTGYDSDFIYGRSDLKDLVAKAVENLIESRRKVVKLYLLNLSIEEIALYFHWSPHKTRNLLYRGLLDLKKTLKQNNIDYEHRR